MDDTEKTEQIMMELFANPVLRTLQHEHRVILQLVQRIEELNGSLLRQSDDQRAAALNARLAAALERLAATDLHHQREEEVLFPELERAGAFSITDALRSEHTRLTEQVAQLQILVDRDSAVDIPAHKKRLSSSVRSFARLKRAHIFTEENLLFPELLARVRTDHRWQSLRAACDQIGYPSLEVSPNPAGA